MYTSSPNQSIPRWLLLCCAMIFVMALIGAVTRLTESGLSITEWAPVAGAIPPLNEAAWNKAFAAYQTIPQYQLLHHGMSLVAFKHIFFWEWLHRLWGRLIGLVFAVPYLYFLIRGRMDKKLAWTLAGIFALGGLQGFIGWFMVQSGLETNTHVSPYRLALHLGAALLLYVLLLWVALGLMRWRSDSKKETPSPAKTKTCHEGQVQVFATSPSRGEGGLWRVPCFHSQSLGWLALCMLAVTMTWGAFVAGLHAGMAYNTWPLMDGTVLPQEAFTLIPAWLNAFANTALVQFIHRWLAPVTGVVILTWVYTRLRLTMNAVAQRWLYALAAMVLVQIGLGISTLLSEVNIVLATLHQAGAITLLTLMVVNLRMVSLIGE